MSNYDSTIEEQEETAWEYAFDDLGNPTLRWKNEPGDATKVADSADQTQNLLRALDCPTLTLAEENEESFDPYDTGVRLHPRTWE